MKKKRFKKVIFMMSVDYIFFFNVVYFGVEEITSSRVSFIIECKKKNCTAFDER